MHQLYCITNGKQTNITPIVGSITWRSNINELGDQLDFDLANNDAYFPKSPVDLGSQIILRNKDEIFRGIVITEQKNGIGAIQYNVFDYAFYLNKSKGVYQFNKVAASEAIKKVCKDFNVPIGNIENIKLAIKKIYRGNDF